MKIKNSFVYYYNWNEINDWEINIDGEMKILNIPFTIYLVYDFIFYNDTDKIKFKRI